MHDERTNVGSTAAAYPTYSMVLVLVVVFYSTVPALYYYTSRVYGSQ